MAAVFEVGQGDRFWEVHAHDGIYRVYAQSAKIIGNRGTLLLHTGGNAVALFSCEAWSFVYEGGRTRSAGDQPNSPAEVPVD